jgi:hypothetical protein
VSPEGISTDPEELIAVQEWPTPQNKHDTRSFLGLCTYYRRFISAFANIANPLTKLAKRKRSFQGTSEAQFAFENLKLALCAAPILVYPNRGEEFTVDTDTSNFETGGMLSQVQNGQVNFFQDVKGFHSHHLQLETLVRLFSWPSCDDVWPCHGYIRPGIHSNKAWIITNPAMDNQPMVYIFRHDSHRVPFWA